MDNIILYCDAMNKITSQTDIDTEFTILFSIVTMKG